MAEFTNRDLELLNEVKKVVDKKNSKRNKIYNTLFAITIIASLYYSFGEDISSVISNIRVKAALKNMRAIAAEKKMQEYETTETPNDDKTIEIYEDDNIIVSIDDSIVNQDVESASDLINEYDSYINWLNTRFGDNKNITDSEFRIPMNINNGKSESTEVEEKEVLYKDTIDYSEGSFFVDNQIETRNIDFDLYKEHINSDIVGYLEIPGLLGEKASDDDLKNFMVVQNSEYLTSENEEKRSLDYYSKHDVLNGRTDKGAIQQDERNDSLGNSMDGIADVNIVYGHNWPDSTRFHAIGELIKDKPKKAFLENLPYGIFYSASGELYKIDFFAVNVVDGAHDSEIYSENFNSEEEYDLYVNRIVENADYCINENIPQDGSKLIALVTCSYEGRYPYVNGKPNDRTVLYGKLTKQKKYIKEIENNEVKTLKLN